jgi:hypothetical protein
MNALVRRGLASDLTTRLTLLEVEASYAAGIAALQNSHGHLRSELAGQEIAQRVRGELESQLLGRIRQLRVSATDKFVILTGSCNSYYTKQLAQHVAMELLDCEHLVNNIAVLPAK